MTANNWTTKVQKEDQTDADKRKKKSKAALHQQITGASLEQDGNLKDSVLDHSVCK